MSKFSIESTALIEVRRILQNSALVDPIACLSESADPDELLSASIESFIKRNADKRSLDNELVNKVERLTYVLEVFAYEKKQCPPDALILVNGVMFSFSPYVYEALSEYCLIFKEGRFFLKSGDDFASNLRSVRTLSTASIKKPA